ncbi:MAG: UMP kinase [Tenuifilaceae bacterium]
MSKFKRVLLKLSGESLMGNDSYGINTNIINSYAKQIKEVAELGVEVGIVIGGGNIFRGLSGVSKGFDRVKGDQMGMLATVINSIALQSAIESQGGKAKVYTATKMEPVGELYSKAKVLESFKMGYVAIIAGGTGNPFFTTDTASALRGVEIEAEALLKGTRVDGVYTADPEKDKSATRYDTITFAEAYEKKLKIMDLTAFTMCSENNLPILVFDMNTEGNLKKLILGEKVGTLVKN